MCMGVTAATIEKASRGNLERNESFRGKPDHLSEENWGEIVAKVEMG